MSAPLPQVRSRARARNASYRTIFAAVVLGGAALWIAVSTVLGFSYQAIGCDGCHAMAPYAQATASSSHAAVECATCHRSSGLTGVMADGIGLQRMALMQIVGSRPQGAPIDDARCLSCHEDVPRQTVTGVSVRVRHADFLAAPCTECHGGTGHTLESHAYTAPEMESCVGCHQVAGTQLDACATCHIEGDDSAQTIRDKTSWRATHGSEWESTHGAGDLDTCTSCHMPGFCITCHGVAVPHDDSWGVTHGEDVDADTESACLTCHEATWCTQCHGIEMPHPDTFLPTHAESVDALGEASCLSCHGKKACDTCHTKHTHPDVPGVTTPKQGW